MHLCEKHYPHSLGLSAAFRQWKATSHCRFIHGYALAFTFKFEAADLDNTNWVMDFGNLKPVKQWLELKFDHKLCVALDDPFAEHFRELERLGVVQIEYMDNVGCEAFAKMAGEFCLRYLRTSGASPRVRLVSIWCAEHDGNRAGWFPPEVSPDTSA
jgi:6-pyruvoyltetrahydropterin/6-carboxytetrahydropterin synthase